MQTKIIKPKEKTSRSIKTKDVANVLKVADKVGEAVAGSKEWFEEKKIVSMNSQKLIKKKECRKERLAIGQQEIYLKTPTRKRMEG